MARFPLSRFVERARGLGAVGAKVIRADTVVTAAWVRLKCQYGCGGFNSSLSGMPSWQPTTKGENQ